MMGRGGWRQRKHLRRSVRGKSFSAGRRLVGVDGVSRQGINALAGQAPEFGGFMDFDKKGRLERFSVFPGDEVSVNPPPADFEVQWHTHTGAADANLAPSEGDLAALVSNGGQQSEIIFLPDSAVVITKTARSPKTINPLLLRQWDADIQGITNRTYRKYGWDGKSPLSKEIHAKARREIEAETFRYVKSLGFELKVDKRPGRDLKFKIRPVEGKADFDLFTGRKRAEFNDHSDFDRLDVVRDNARIALLGKQGFASEKTKDSVFGDSEVEERRLKLKSLKNALDGVGGGSLSAALIRDEIRKEQGLP